MRIFMVPKGCSPFRALAHGLWVGVEALLHGLQQVLVFPPCDTALRARRALTAGLGMPRELAAFLDARPPPVYFG
jgi:hypothetical protein